MVLLSTHMFWLRNKSLKKSVMHSSGGHGNRVILCYFKADLIFKDFSRKPS